MLTRTPSITPSIAIDAIALGERASDFRIGENTQSSANVVAGISVMTDSTSGNKLRKEMSAAPESPSGFAAKAQAKTYEGWLETRSCPNPEALAEIVAGLGENQCLVLGQLRNHAHGVVVPMVKTDAKPLNPFAVARCNADLAFAYASIVMADVDFGSMDVAEIRGYMARMYPGIADTMWFASPSSSANLKAADGTVLTGAGKWHVYFWVVGGGEAIDAWRKDMLRRDWLNGLGRFELGGVNVRSGVQHANERGVLDNLVFQPPRIAFEGGAICHDGITQDRPAPTWGGAGYLDLAQVELLSAEDVARAAALRDADKAATKGIQIKATAERLIATGEFTPATAEKEARRRVVAAGKCELDADHIITIKGVGDVRFADIAAEHNNAQCLEPQEPDYRGGGFGRAVVFFDEGGARILSYAHGKRVYRMARPSGVGLAVGPVAERAAQITRRLTKLDKFLELFKADTSMRSDAKHRVYSGYCPALTLTTDRSTTAIQGGLGSGKTETIVRLLAQHTDKPVILLQPRNGLLRQTATRIEAGGRLEAVGCDAYHYQDDVALHKRMMQVAQPGVYLMAPDSLKAYATDGVDFGKFIVVIDEFSGIRSEILAKTQSVSEFQRLLRAAKQLIVADAYLSDFDLGLLRSYRPGVRLDVLRQATVKSDKRARMIESTTRDGALALDAGGQMMALLTQFVADGGQSLFISCDNRALARVAEAALTEAGLRVHLCASHTVEANQEFLPSPDAYLAANNIQVCIITPTLQSGGDIQTPFAKGIHIASGTVSPTQQMQLMGRARRCDDWSVIAPRATGGSDVSFRAVSDAMLNQWGLAAEESLASLELVGGDVGTWGAWQSATAEVGKVYCRELLQSLLEQSFASVTTEVIDTTGFRTDEAAKKAAIKLADNAKIIAADPARGAQLVTEHKAPATDADVWSVALYELMGKHPGMIQRILYTQDGRFTPKAEVSDRDLELMGLIRSPRLAKLRNWVLAQYDADRSLIEHMQKYKHANSRTTAYRAFAYQRLYRVLELGELATAHNGQAEHDVTHFSHKSDVLRALYLTFGANAELRRLHPQVSDFGGFVVVVKRCMSHMGFQSHSPGKARLVDPTLARNGRRADGSQRLSPNAPVHLFGWLPHERSGSVLFRAEWEYLCAEMHKSVQREYPTAEPTSSPPG